MLEQGLAARGAGADDGRASPGRLQDLAEDGGQLVHAGVAVPDEQDALRRLGGGRDQRTDEREPKKPATAHPRTGA